MLTAEVRGPEEGWLSFGEGIQDSLVVARPGEIVRVEIIEKRIYLIRRRKVMLDSDLAKLYEVSTHRLNEQVTRNLSRFPDDFMFRLTSDK